MKIVMNGALGRMGRNIAVLSLSDPELAIAGAIDIDCDLTGQDYGAIIGGGNPGVPIGCDLGAVLRDADVVIDFSRAESVPATAALCAESGVPLVEGTTGMVPDARDEFIRTVSPIPCVFAPNMSVGVNLLFRLVADAARLLGDEYDIEIMETHHRFKKDAPSGTAARLAEIIAETLDRDPVSDVVYGRAGITGERPRREIGVHALRMGDVVGEHTVSFGTLGERIELTHKAQSRDALARGALLAAKFIVNAQPGLYDMQDVLGMK